MPGHRKGLIGVTVSGVSGAGGLDIQEALTGHGGLAFPWHGLYHNTGQATYTSMPW